MRKAIVHLLTVALCLLFVGVSDIAAKSKAEKAVEFAAQVKAQIAQLGAGPDAHIQVELRDKSKLNGYVSKIGDESFIVTDVKTGAVTEIPYPSVAKVKGSNASTGTWIAVGVAIVVVAVVLSYFLSNR